MSKQELRDMIDAMESAIRTGDSLIIGLTVGQVLESMKNIADRDDQIVATTDGVERMRITPGRDPVIGDTRLDVSSKRSRVLF